MLLDPQSPEFARLATRWLDGSASAGEASRLWESVRGDKACAREFAEQARFELLLQDTLREKQREQGIAAGARQEASRQHKTMARKRLLAAAAVLVAAGLVVWLVLPSPPLTRQDIASMPTNATEKPAPPRTKLMSRGTTVLMTRQDTPNATNQGAGEALKKRLDDFFLTGVDLDKVPLSQAIKQLEDQLRELNFANSTELAVLHVKLPAGLADQPVTFHSGGISFLKAVRALAGLAGYDLEVSDTTLALVAQGSGSPYRQESHSVQELLANLGSPTDANRNRLAELIYDARSLGLRLDLATDGSGNVTGLHATAGELQALALLAQSRDQIRGLPPLRFYVKATRGSQGAQDRILSGAEAERERQSFLLSSGGTSPMVITVPLMESSLAQQSSHPGEIQVSAGPVGDNRIYLNIDPGLPADPTTLAPAINPIATNTPASPPQWSTLPPGPHEPIVAITKRGEGFILPSPSLLTTNNLGFVTASTTVTGPSTQLLTSATTTSSGSLVGGSTLSTTSNSSMEPASGGANDLVASSAIVVGGLVTRTTTSNIPVTGNPAAGNGVNLTFLPADPPPATEP